MQKQVQLIITDLGIDYQKLKEVKTVIIIIIGGPVNPKATSAIFV